jgi:hypothetical protein
VEIILGRVREINQLHVALAFSRLDKNRMLAVPERGGLSVRTTVQSALRAYLVNGCWTVTDSFSRLAGIRDLRLAI